MLEMNYLGIWYMLSYFPLFSGVLIMNPLHSEDSGGSNMS